jgi:hypothetical protein
LVCGQARLLSTAGVKETQRYAASWSTSDDEEDNDEEDDDEEPDASEIMLILPLS